MFKPINDEKNLYLLTDVANSDLELTENNSDKKSTPEILQNETTIRALDRNTGITNWQTTLPKDTYGYLNFFRGFILCLSKNGNFYLINPLNGNIVKKKSLGNLVSAFPNEIINPNNKFFYLGMTDNSIVKVSDEGTILTKLKTNSIPTVIIENSSDDNLLYSDKKGSIISFDVRRGKSSWVIRTGAEITNLTLTQSGVLITSLDNFVYLVSDKNGKLIWKKRLSGRITIKPLIVGDYAILNVIGEPELLIVELSDGKILNKSSFQTEELLEDISSAGNFILYSTPKKISAITFQANCPR